MIHARLSLYSTFPSSDSGSSLGKGDPEHSREASVSASSWVSGKEEARRDGDLSSPSQGLPTRGLEDRLPASSNIASSRAKKEQRDYESDEGFLKGLVYIRGIMVFNSAEE
jgi:hypothetical protein